MRILDRLFPQKYFADGSPMSREEESAHWIATCADCGNERSIADLGGVRYRASGSPTKMLPCTNCAGQRKMKVTWQPPT